MSASAARTFGGMAASPQTCEPPFFVPEAGRCVLVALVSRRNVLERWTDELLIDLVTGCTAVLSHYRFRGIVVERGTGPAGHAGTDQKSYPTVLHRASPLQGR